MQLLRLRARASTLLFKGGDQPRHGAIITPAPPGPSESEPAGGWWGAGHAHTSTLPPWPWKPLPSQRKNRAPPERAASGDSPQPGSPGSLGHPRPQPRPASGSRTPDSGRPDKRQTPQRLPDTRVSRPGRGPRAAGDPSSACPAEHLPNLTTVGPQPGPGSAGDSPPGAGYSSSPSDKGARRPDSRGAGALQGPGPLWRPQGPASHTPAPRCLKGIGQQGVPSWRTGARKGACCLVPGGERLPNQGAGPRLGEELGTRDKEQLLTLTPGQEAGPHPPGATEPQASLVRTVQKRPVHTREQADELCLG